MKIIHISDLHLGKYLGGHSFLDDQKAILFQQILPIVDLKKPEAVLLSGDIYDTKAPSGEAMRLFDDFLVELFHRNVHVFAISGNHDSGIRINLFHELLSASGYHTCGVYQGKVASYTLEDEYGPVNFYLVPYLNPGDVRVYHPFESGQRPFDDALKEVLRNEEIDTSKRNVILSHQMVIGSSRSESNTCIVGQKDPEYDQVSLDTYRDFDYVALGHIHKRMSFHGSKVVYPGAILPYHNLESNERFVSYVELREKGNMTQEFIPITPKRKMVNLKGSYSEILQMESISDYVAITLVGEVNDPQASVILADKFPYLISISREREYHEEDTSFSSAASLPKTPIETIEYFLESKTNHALSQEDKDLIREIFDEMEKDK